MSPKNRERIPVVILPDDQAIATEVAGRRLPTQIVSTASLGE